MTDPRHLLPWGLGLGMRSGTRQVVDSLGLDAEGRATYRVQCLVCESVAIVTASEWLALEPCCRGRRSRRAR